MMHGLRLGVLALCLMLVPVGCAVQDDSAEAKLEKAMMAMDIGDYTTALAVLNALCPDPNACADHILSLMAEAQMGLSGIELLNLLNAVEAIGAGAGNTAVWAAVDSLFGVGGISAGDVASLGNAVATLQTLGAPTSSDQLQLAIAAAGHMVAAVTAVTDPGNTGTHNPAAITATELNAVVTDLLLIVTNVAAVDAALGTGSDLTGDLNGLTADIEAAGGGTVNGTIELAELQAFVGAL